MALTLNIPTLKDNPAIIAEIRPQKISQSLTDNITNNPLDIASQIHSELEILNRQKIPSTHRMQAIDTYRPFLMNTVQALSGEYNNAALPLHDKAKLAAKAAELLWLELGYGYKLVLVDLQNQLIKFGTEKSSANAIQRAMHAVSEQALTIYQTYSTVPEHIWSDLHQLYFCAVKLNLENMKIDEVKGVIVSTASRANTIENTYKHALLMSLADPQHLTQKHMRVVAEYLAFHVETAKISAATPLEITTSCFIVNLSSNKPPIPYSKQKVAPNPDSDIILQTLDLVFVIHQDLNTLQNNQFPKNGGVPENANRDEYIDLLIYLIKHWGVTQKRIFNRTKSEGEVELVIGIPAIHYLSSSLAELANNDKKSKIQPSDKTTKPSRWHVNNISAIGMSVRRIATAEKNIRIGGLLGFRSKKEQQWSIGLVRWAACGNRDRLDIGVQMIAPRTQSAIAQLDNTGPQEMVLLLPELPAAKQFATIIARVGTYLPARQLSITHNKITYVILLTRIVERSQHFERIQYSVINL